MHPPRRLLVPATIALIACAVLGAGPARAEGRRYLDPIFTNIAITAGLVYGEAPNNRGEVQQLLLDLYEPVGDADPARPVLIWAHGGGFHTGSRTEPRWIDMATRFAQRGYVTASIDYRLRPPGTPNSPDLVHYVAEPIAGVSQLVDDARKDMQAAVRWFRRNAGALRIDPYKIVVAGGSSGAIMALETDFDAEDPGNSGNPEYPSTVAAAVALSGFAHLTAIEAGDGPIMLFHGMQDTTVPLPLALSTCATTMFLGNACETRLYRDEDHGLTDLDDITVRTADFLCRRVLGGCPA